MKYGNVLIIFKNESRDTPNVAAICQLVIPVLAIHNDVDGRCVCVCV